ncbi:MAG: hypothetical protein IPK07_28155 [Deltaproteobacteria bacterium]|nr:hypothetical protein [Deltaproteobacteria bacterium]
MVKGVAVRGEYLTAVINHGNLTLLGLERWGDIDVSTAPAVGADAALATVRAHADPFVITGTWGKTERILVATAKTQVTGRSAAATATGSRGSCGPSSWATPASTRRSWTPSRASCCRSRTPTITRPSAR